MPVYNCVDYIDDAITSIINQSYANWELIIIDDCSQDNTLGKIEKYKDSRIFVIKNEINKGLPACLNICINKSRGEYFARMDGDDIMVKDRLEKQIVFLSSNPNIDVIGSLAYLIDRNNKIKGFKKCIFPENLDEVIKFQGYFIHPTVMGKVEWFIQNMYDEKIKRCQDFELWLRTYNFSNFYVLRENLLFYREVQANYKQKYYQVYLNLKQILKKHRNLLSIKQYYLSLMIAYLKYMLFDIFVFIGLLQPKQELGLNDIEEIQKQLNKVME